MHIKTLLYEHKFLSFIWTHVCTAWRASGSCYFMLLASTLITNTDHQKVAFLTFRYKGYKKDPSIHVFYHYSIYGHNCIAVAVIVRRNVKRADRHMKQSKLGLYRRQTLILVTKHPCTHCFTLEVPSDFACLTRSTASSSECEWCFLLSQVYLKRPSKHITQPLTTFLNSTGRGKPALI